MAPFVKRRERDSGSDRKTPRCQRQHMPTTYATAFVAHHARGSTFRLRDPTLRRPTMDWPRQHANRCFFRYASTQGPNRSAHRIGLPASGATRQPYSYASSQAQLLPPRRLLLSPRSTSGLSSSETLSPLPAPLWCSLPFRDGGALSPHYHPYALA